MSTREAYTIPSHSGPLVSRLSLVVSLSLSLALSLSLSTSVFLSFSLSEHNHGAWYILHSARWLVESTASEYWCETQSESVRHS
jgi:hypothetical protein